MNGTAQTSLHFGDSQNSTPIWNVETYHDCCGFEPCGCPEQSENLRQLTFFAGLDGSKQPQDFGVNANLGMRGSVNYSAPLSEQFGLGFQIGTAIVGSGNAVQVYELLGESRERFQSFSTVGIFQRLPSGVAWGAAYDWLYQESFDDFTLGQWRVRASIDIGKSHELGMTLNLKDRGDNGSFNATTVVLEPIDQFNIFWRTYWPTQVRSTIWIGVADRHGEENIVTGGLPARGNMVLFGADIYAPLNAWVAIYGETNLVMPADTGAVDAYLGFEWSPYGNTMKLRGQRFRPLLPVASNPSFTTNLIRD